MPRIQLKIIGGLAALVIAVVTITGILAERGLRVPHDVSLICTDPDRSFIWSNPSVAHIHWDHRPVVRRIVQWVNNVALGKNDRRKSSTKAKVVEGGTVGRAPKRIIYKD